MEITQIRVFPVHEDKLKAFVSVVFDHCFVVSDIKIIEGTSGLFVSMPSKKRKNGTFRDIAHPLNSETRRKFEEQIITRFREVITESGGSTTIRLRELGADADEHAHELRLGPPDGLPARPGGEDRFVP
jgi:stage V sporulation protein G